jgi:predicted CXXCH cytochrome family protein
MMHRLGAGILLILVATSAHAFTPNSHNSLDCLFCHGEEPIFGVDTRDTVTFYRNEGDDPALCYVCHEPEENLHPVEVRPGETALKISPPADLPLGTSAGMEGRVVCITCHSIHASNAAAALLRGFPGTQNIKGYDNWQQFCRQCHGDILERRSPHAGDERACAFCHTVRPEEGEQVEILPRGVRLCNFCHGAIQKDHLSGVNPYDGPVDCLTCHDPHIGPDQKARLKPEYFDYLRGAVTVNPHRRKFLCSLCHVEDKTFTLITRDSTALCNRCHATPKVVGEMHPLSEVTEKTKVPKGWPLSKGRMTCLTCHPPGHLEDEERVDLLRGGPYGSRNAFCARCHDYTELAGTDPHLPIHERKGCENCHVGTPDLGKDTAETVTFPTSINLLCLRCHEDTGHPGGATHTIFPGEARASGIPEHLPLNRYKRITCTSCHNPHFPKSEKYKLRDPMGGGTICLDCHAL